MKYRNVGRTGKLPQYLTQNTKLKRDNIFSFSIPAGTTCPGAGLCKQYCYAKKGNYRFETVQNALKRNFKLTRDPLSFVEIMSREIERRDVRTLRIHASGDFYSHLYIMTWFTIMRRNPHVNFYAYTKSFHLFQNPELSIYWPNNFRVIYSEGSRYDAMIDQDRHRHARIFQSLADMEAAGYVNASESDMVAVTTNSKRIGLLFH